MRQACANELDGALRSPRLSRACNGDGRDLRVVAQLTDQLLQDRLERADELRLLDVGLWEAEADLKGLVLRGVPEHVALGSLLLVRVGLVALTCCIASHP